MEKNYQHIRDVCQKQSKLSKTVIDEFLIHYAAQASKLDRDFKRKMQPFRHICRELPQGWEELLTSQYIAHRIFKRNGLIRKYLNHSGLDVLSAEEKAFLGTQAKHPWRYSFADIARLPEQDFFEMHDILTGERYLLFSPGITSILQTETPMLWLNLIGWNGECWQTYGPILYFNGFEEEDIFYYANKVNNEWYETGEDVREALEENPVPFSMLISGSNLPLVFHDEHQIVSSNAEYKVEEAFDSKLFKSDFRIEYSHGVYKLSLKGWDEFPHYCTAFYEEKEQMLCLYAMTDSGFGKLVDVLNGQGFTLEHTPDERANMGMLTTASKILKRELTLNPYDHLFTIETPPDEKQNLDRINALFGELMPFINNRQTPDLDALSSKYGVDPEEVRGLYEMVKKKLD